MPALDEHLESAVEQLAVALSAAMTENLQELNRQLSRRSLRAFASRPNLSGIQEISGINRERLNGALKGELLLASNEVRLLCDLFAIGPAQRTKIESLHKRCVEADASRHFSQQESAFPLLDASVDSLYELNRWTSGRPLLRENASIASVAAGQTLLDEAILRKVRLEACGIDAAGSVSVVRRIGSVDWREDPSQMVFEVEVDTATYAETIAFRSIAMSDDDLGARLVESASAGDSTSLLQVAPFLKVSANVNVLSSDGMMLAVKRSPAVQSFKNEWNLGVNETMRAPSPSGECETLHQLVIRAVEEEVGLLDDDLKAVVISWAGICLDCADFVVFSHVQTGLAAADVERRRWRSFSSQEHSAHAHLPATDRTLAALVGGPGRTPDGGGSWLHHARLSAQQLWIARDQLTM